MCLSIHVAHLMPELLDDRVLAYGVGKDEDVGAQRRQEREGLCNANGRRSYIDMHTSLSLSACYIYLDAYMHTDARTHTHTHTYIYTCIHMYIHICIYIYTCTENKAVANFNTRAVHTDGNGRGALESN